MKNNLTTRINKLADKVRLLQEANEIETKNKREQLDDEIFPAFMKSDPIAVDILKKLYRLSGAKMAGRMLDENNNKMLRLEAIYDERWNLFREEYCRNNEKGYYSKK